MVDRAEASGAESNAVVVRGWPRWAAAVVTVTGLVVVVAETTSFLVIPGLVLIGFGIYGFVAGSRVRKASSYVRTARVSSSER